jgi:hypothetical protein
MPSPLRKTTSGERRIGVFSSSAAQAARHCLFENSPAGSSFDDTQLREMAQKWLCTLCTSCTAEIGKKHENDQFL